MDQALYQRLCEIAKEGKFTRYSEVAQVIGLDMSYPEHRNQISLLLDQISRYEHDNGRPLLSVVVIHIEDNIPGNGFFSLAKELGLFRNKDRLSFFIDESRRVHDYWSTKSQ